jgi:hypothetical protein
MLSLTEELRQLGDRLRKQIPNSHYDTIAKAIQDLTNSGLTASAIREGDLAPDFELPDALGVQVSLGGLLKNGPVVLSFYRGGW